MILEVALEEQISDFGSLGYEQFDGLGLSINLERLYLVHQLTKELFVATYAGL